MDKELLLYNYFSDQLTVEQKILFEELLKTDASFKQQFDFEKDLKQVIRNTEKDVLKDKLAGFEKEISSEAPVRSLPHTNYKKWAMAASILLLVGLSWLGYNNLAGPNYNDLFEENFRSYPNTVFEISRGESVETIERSAFTQYELGNYRDALASFEKIPSVDRNDYVDFYIGMSYLNLEQYAKARDFLHKVAESESKLKAEAHWYLAMISLKTKNKEQALQWLEILVNQYDYQKERSQEIIEALN